MDKLKDKRVSWVYVRAMQEMYFQVMTCVSTQYFPVQVGLHQDSSLCPFLFTIIKDVLTRRIHDEVP